MGRAREREGRQKGKERERTYFSHVTQFFDSISAPRKKIISVLYENFERERERGKKRLSPKSRGEKGILLTSIKLAIRGQKQKYETNKLDSS